MLARKKELAMKTFTLNRRTLLTGAVATSSVGFLAACGAGNGGKTTGAESASALGVGEDIAKLISMNPKKREELRPGGEVNLAMLTLGPDFSPVNSNGNTLDSVTVMSAVHASAISGCWMYDFEGKPAVNPDFCASFETELENGVQTHRIKLNPKAQFNDGTPIDIEALRATVKAMSGKNSAYNIVTSGAYEFVESIEHEGDAIKVTMSRPYYPIQSLFANILHPALAEVKNFNDGFVDNPRPEWGAGPFTVADWNSSEKRLALVPNNKWWGEKPVLERLIWRQMESSAQRAAFKNGELDAMRADTLTAYKDIEKTEGTEVRRGQRLWGGGIDMMSGRIPVELRKAIMASLDRKALAEIRFNGLNWSEEIPGSNLLMPFSEQYEDNFEKVVGKWDAAKILEDAGYKKSGDFYAKDGKNASFAITIFGDDPVNSAMAQALVQQMKSAGIEATIDTQPDANYGNVLGNYDYDYTIAGWTIGSDATVATNQYYSKANGNEKFGDDDIDAMIKKMQVTEDDAERNKLCNEIEAKHLERYAAQATAFNGPLIQVVKKNLANYGAPLFGGFDVNPGNWSLLGWVKE